VVHAEHFFLNQPNDSLCPKTLVDGVIEPKGAIMLTVSEL